jgi:hypothetical protein
MEEEEGAGDRRCEVKAAQRRAVADCRRGRGRGISGILSVSRMRWVVARLISPAGLRPFTAKMETVVMSDQ